MNTTIRYKLERLSMGDTSIRVSEDLADELYDRKERGDSYEDVIWRLIEQAEERDSDTHD